jgi:hypothetical protein
MSPCGLNAPHDVCFNVRVIKDAGKGTAHEITDY